MKALALVILAWCFTFNVAAEPATPRGKSLGVINASESETRPAVEIQELARLHPSSSVLIVVATAPINKHVTDHYKWLYDRRTKTLAYMRRTTMRTLEDDCGWVIWRDIELEAFANRLPFSAQFKPVMSPLQRAKQSFPLFYPENPAITDWP